MSTPIRALTSEIRDGVAELGRQARRFFDEMAELRDRGVQLQRLKGREVQELPDDHLPGMRQTAYLRSRPASAAAVVMLVVTAVTAAITAPAAGAWRPWQAIEQAIGQPIRSDNPLLSWLIHQAATTSLIGGLLWLIGYASWLGAARDLTALARRGYSAWFTRLRLGLLTLAGAAFTYIQLGHLGGPIHPLVGAGLVVTAWRMLAWTTIRQARVVNTLNEVAARTEIANLDAAADAAANKDAEVAAAPPLTLRSRTPLAET